MKVMPMLIRREFWEHRVMLVFAPLVLCVLYLILTIAAGAGLEMKTARFGVASSSAPIAVLIVMHTLFTVMLYLLMAIVAFFYLCDCLYSERKDRSILFWKSLPVSDTATVLSKFIVGLVAIPVVVYVLSLVTNLIAFGILRMLSHSEVPAHVASNWTFLGWVRLNGYLIADIFVLALWYAPIAAYQLLISSVSPRAPFVLTVLPPVALIFGEALFFDTWHIGHFLGHRLGSVQFGPRIGRGAQDVIDALNALPLLGSLELWIGVLVAAAVIAVTVRIRRHRDDS